MMLSHWVIQRSPSPNPFFWTINKGRVFPEIFDYILFCKGPELHMGGLQRCHGHNPHLPGLRFLNFIGFSVNLVKKMIGPLLNIDTSQGKSVLGSTPAK